MFLIRAAIISTIFAYSMQAYAQDPEEVFDSENITLYDMTYDELLKVSPQKLLKEINLLTGRNQVEGAELNTLKSFNERMCQKLASLKASCTSLSMITSDISLDGLDCGKESQVSVQARIGGGGKETYRLIANDKYISNELSGNGQSTVQFKRNDSKLVKPPRFRDLTTLKLVATKAGGSVGERTERSPQLSFSLNVNGKPLLSSFALEAPSDATDLSTYLVNPQGILGLRQQQGCSISLQELESMKASR